MAKTNDKPKESQAVEEPTAINVLIYLYPEVFSFFKTVYAKRKSELKAKLDNRPTKEKKETLLAEEIETSSREFESHPLFNIYHSLSRPFLVAKAFYDNALAAMPQALNAGAITESDLKAKEIVQYVIEKCVQQNTNPGTFDLNDIMKKLAEIPEITEEIKSIANSKDSLGALVYHLIKLDGENHYIKFVIKTYEDLQAGKIKTIESKKEAERQPKINPQQDQGELETLIQDTVRQVLSEQNLEEREPVDEIMSTEQASLYLNLAVQTIYGFTSKNEIPFFKRGKKLYFKRSELEQWILEGKQKTIKETQKEAIDYINKRKK